jgi:hypothetical protein
MKSSVLRIISWAATVVIVAATVVFGLTILFDVTSRGIEIASADYYVSPLGSDENIGSADAPFATWEKAESVARPGDLVYFRGGRYKYASKEIRLSVSGHSDAPIRYWAYPGEHPVFELSGIPSPQNGLVILADWIHIAGMEFSDAVHICVRLIAGPDGGPSASNNTLERLIVHNCGNSGIVLWGSNGGVENNLILNADSYRNYFPPSNGNQGDGIAVGGGVGIGNVIRGCRAWANADDGFDTWDAGNPVRLENNWAFDNGYNLWHPVDQWEGGGHGFKLGRSKSHMADQPESHMADQPESHMDRHVVVNNYSVGNAAYGFNDNRNRAPMQLLNNTAYGNEAGQYKVEHAEHIMRNNIAYGEGIKLGTYVDDAYNSWNLDRSIQVTEDDFLSLDPSLVRMQRDSEGNLPEIDFLQLSAKSDLKGAGEDQADLGASIRFDS